MSMDPLGVAASVVYTPFIPQLSGESGEMHWMPSVPKSRLNLPKDRGGARRTGVLGSEVTPSKASSLYEIDQLLEPKRNHFSAPYDGARYK